MMPAVHSEQNSPFQIFLASGAGTGNGLLIKAINSMAAKQLQSEGDNLQIFYFFFLNQMELQLLTYWYII